ncbi:MAG: trigger factor [Spirochaetales bacterium]|nr:trigger factor [Spirochaetales bacterium]
MKYDYKEEYLGNAKGQVTITIPAKEMMTEYNKQIEEIKKDAVIPGFRKGHVPTSIIETKYRKYIWGDACNHMAGQAFSEVFLKLDRNPIGQEMPKRVGEEVEPEFNKDYTIVMEYNCVPDFKYKDLNTFEVVKDEVTVSKADIDKQLEKTLQEYSTFEVKDGKIAKDDIAYINYTVKEGDKEVYKNENEYINLKLNMDTYKVGEDIVGMAKGEKKSYKKTFEDKEGVIDALKGKTFNIDLSINEIKTEKIPEITNELCEEIDPDIHNETELRKKIEDDLKKYAENMVNQCVLTRFTEELIKSFDGEVPEVLIDDVLERELHEYHHRAENAKKTLAEVLAEDNLTEANFKTERREEAIGGVKIGLIEQDLIKKNNLKATEEEIKDHIKDFSKYYKGIDPEMMYKYYAQNGQLEQFATQVENDKVHKLMTDSVKYKKGKTYTFEDMPKMFDDLNEEMKAKKK